MYVVLFFEIMGAVLAAFGLVCLWHFATDTCRMPFSTLDAVVYDGSFEQEELGRLVRCAEPCTYDSRRAAVLVMDGVSLSDDVARTLEENGVLIYYITDR